MAKSIKKVFAALLLFTLLVGMLGSCELLPIGEEASEITILGGEVITLGVGDTYQLEYEANGRIYGEVSWESSNPFVDVSDDGLVTAYLSGDAIITLKYKDTSDTIVIIANPTNNGDSGNGSGGSGNGSGGSGGEDIVIPADKYKNMTAEEFYSDYEPAVSYLDAILRSAEGFMSGDITTPDQAPITPSHVPMSGGKYVRNSSTYFSDGGYSYTVVDGRGNEVLKVYKGGGYITLEEVAAYVYAFGEVPPNYDSDKDCDYVSESSKSEWGKYLRLNDSKFSGSTAKYPYEPELPNISGCGGTYQYYEIDIGTTGTDCDPKYSAVLYNNGTRIDRGAARIVYVKYDGSRRITDPTERYVFYTYNHYNDFQEYLNYYGGWGEKFGNITGGGTISSKYNYNPTPYVEVERGDFSAVTVEMVFIPYAILDKRYL